MGSSMMRVRLRIANRYEGIKPFSEGLAAMKIRNKWGFINRDERIIIQPAYEEVTPFKKGYSFIKQNGLFWFADKRRNACVAPSLSIDTGSGEWKITPHR
jgi:hypothetical protein